MSAGETSEEKTLPASPKKLRDARKKGQIAQARDFASSVVLVAAVGFVWTRFGSLTSDWREILLYAARMQNEPLQTAVPQIGASLVALAGRTVAPLLLVVVAAGILASVVANGGLLFSLDPLKPKPEHLNPIAGLKRMFGMRALVDLAKTIVKAIALGATLLIVFFGTWNTLVLLPVCGLNCLAFVIGAQAKLLLSIAVGAFLAAGIFDILVQRWLFLREMRMSQSEMKREMKEMEGDPTIKGVHKRHQKEASELPRLGLRFASVLIQGHERAVGLRYVPKESGVPVIVCRASGEAAAAMIAAAAELRIPRIVDYELATDLARRTPPGSPLPKRHFDAGARALHEAGVV